MHYRVRGWTAALIATTVLALSASDAFATAIGISNQGIRFTQPDFTINGGPGFTVSCPVTIEGSFHARTISKTANGLIGYITSAAVVTAACTGGRLIPLNLPWHIQYSSFTGTLPAIRTIEMHTVNEAWLAEIPPLSCLYKTTPTEPAGLIAEIVEGRMKTYRWSEARIPIWIGTGLCPGSIRYGGGGRSTVLGSSEEGEVSLV